MNLPKKMQAAILCELTKDLVIANINLPNELEIGQVLVKVHFSGICGTQLGEIDGAKGVDNYLPHLLGHEGSGKVVAVGPGVKTVAPYDNVVLHWKKGTGIESNTPSYSWNGRKVNAGWVTTFNQYAVISENRCTKIQDECDLKIAALFGCAITTGFGVIENNANVKIGESVVVYGAGGVGLNIVQAASLKNAYPIIAVDIHHSRINLAKVMGATHIINSSEINAEEEIQKITENNGVDVFIDNTGKSAIIEIGYRVTKKDGRVILVGVPKYNDNINVNTLALHFGKLIKGSHGGDCCPEKDIPRYFNLYKHGKVQLNTLISEVIDLNEINYAISKMRSGEIAGRCLIKMPD